jgi:hypothetical protein
MGRRAEWERKQKEEGGGGRRMERRKGERWDTLGEKSSKSTMPRAKISDACITCGEGGGGGGGGGGGKGGKGNVKTDNRVGGEGVGSDGLERVGAERMCCI